MTRITIPGPGESVLFEARVNNVQVRRLPDDPLALRVSLGESHEHPDAGIYCVYRGELNRVRAVLRQALAALDALPSAKTQ